MPYVIAWILYVSMAALLVLGHERYVAGHVASRQRRIFLRAFLLIILFTPGFVAAGDNVYIVPACVGVMFNILAKSGIGLLKAALPLLLVSSVVFGVLFFRESGRRDADEDRTRQH